MQTESSVFERLQSIETKFETAPQVLSWLVKNNPARHKSINLIERDSSSSTHEDPATFWALVSIITWRAIKRFDESHRIAFAQRYLAPTDMQQSATDIAFLMGKHERTVKRWIYRVLEELELEYIDVGLIPDEHRNQENKHDNSIRAQQPRASSRAN